MKVYLLPLLGLTFISIAPALAGDHNNIDANRPLSFDDAESIGFREQSLEFGTGVNWSDSQDFSGEFEVEYLYGFALNSHFSIGIEPRIGQLKDSNETEFDIGDLAVGIFHNFNREYNNTPAFAIRTDASFPTGRDSQGVEFRLRGIASKTVGQYDRLHVNLDLIAKTETEPGERSIIPGMIIGYSHPLGYPRTFDRTLVAQLGISASEETEGTAIVSPGIGLRQQVSPQSVLDLGLKVDWDVSNSEESELSLVMGYSFSF